MKIFFHGKYPLHSNILLLIILFREGLAVDKGEAADPANVEAGLQHAVPARPRAHRPQAHQSEGMS